MVEKTSGEGSTDTPDTLGRIESDEVAELDTSTLDDTESLDTTTRTGSLGREADGGHVGYSTDGPYGSTTGNGDEVTSSGDRF